MKKKWLLLEGIVALYVIFLSLWVMVPTFLGSQNINTEEHIPDPRFRRLVEECIGVGKGDIITKEQAANQVVVLDISPFNTGETGPFTIIPPTFSDKRNIIWKNPTIKVKPINLKGIELFTNLKTIHIHIDYIDRVDLTENTALEEIHIYGNPNTSLSKIQSNKKNRFGGFSAIIDHRFDDKPTEVTPPQYAYPRS